MQVVAAGTADVTASAVESDEYTGQKDQHNSPANPAADDGTFSAGTRPNPDTGELEIQIGQDEDEVLLVNDEKQDRDVGKKRFMEAQNDFFGDSCIVPTKKIKQEMLEESSKKNAMVSISQATKKGDI